MTYLRNYFLVLCLIFLLTGNAYSVNYKILLEKKPKDISIAYECTSDIDENRSNTYGFTYAEGLSKQKEINMYLRPYYLDSDTYGNATFFVVPRTDNKLSFFFPDNKGYLIAYDFLLVEENIFSEENKVIVLERSYYKPTNESGMKMLGEANSIMINILSLKDSNILISEMLKLFNKNLDVFQSGVKELKSSKVICNRKFINQ